MADRDLRVTDFIKLYEAHGCRVQFTRRQKVLVSRRVGAEVLHFSQHAHKGLHDTFTKRTVRISRRRLQYDRMPDDEFYKPLD